MKDGLTLRDNAKADLMQIRSIEDGVTQRILAELIKNGQANGESKTQATAKSTTAKEVDQFGLSHKQSSAFSPYMPTISYQISPVRTGLFICLSGCRIS